MAEEPEDVSNLDEPRKSARRKKKSTSEKGGEK
jgi:hypothetical protein